MGFFADRRIKNMEKALIKAVSKGDAEKVRELLAQGVDINACAPHTDHRTPLCAALAEGQDNVAEMLIHAGASLENALRYAVRNRREKIVELLITKGEDVTRPISGEDWTPLHYAALAGDLRMCKILLAAGADPSGLNNRGDAPSHVARSYGHTGIADFLNAWGRESVSPLPSADAAPVISSDDPWRMPEEQSGKEIVRVSLNRAIGYRLTEIFNFEMQTYTRLAQNIETKAESQVMKSFDEFGDTSFIEQAREEYKKRGGALPDKSIGGLTIKKP